MTTDDLAILVNTCDAYSDVWVPFAECFRAFWPGCQYRVYFNTDKKTERRLPLAAQYIVSESTAGTNGWGQRLAHALKQIESDYVLNLFDDYLFNSPVDAEEIARVRKIMAANDAIAAFYFSDVIEEKSRQVYFDRYAKVKQFADYKVNSAPGLWRKEDLLRVTGTKDNPWAWEYFGSYRTYFSSKEFYCVKNAAAEPIRYNYRLGGAIHRGKWVRSVIVQVIQRFGIELDTSSRGFEQEGRTRYRHDLLWRLKFLATGFNMIGMGMVLFLAKALLNKMRKMWHTLLRI